MSAFQISVCEAVFQGRKNTWIYEHLYHADPNDHKSVLSAANKLRALKQNPKFQEYYNSMVTEFRVHNYGKAMHKLSDMIDDNNPWVAMQASNIVLNHTERAVVGKEESAVTVKIEGLPTLGVPEGDERDAIEGANRALLDAGETVEAESSVV